MPNDHREREKKKEEEEAEGSCIFYELEHRIKIYVHGKTIQNEAYILSGMEHTRERAVYATSSRINSKTRQPEFREHLKGNFRRRSNQQIGWNNFSFPFFIFFLTFGKVIKISASSKQKNPKRGSVVGARKERRGEEDGAEKGKRKA